MTKATLITRNQGLILLGLTTLLAKHEVLETTTAKQHTDMLGKVGSVISKSVTCEYDIKLAFPRALAPQALLIKSQYTPALATFLQYNDTVCRLKPQA